MFLFSLVYTKCFRSILLLVLLFFPMSLLSILTVIKRPPTLIGSIVVATNHFASEHSLRWNTCVLCFWFYSVIRWQFVRIHQWLNKSISNFFLLSHFHFVVRTNDKSKSTSFQTNTWLFFKSIHSSSNKTFNHADCRFRWLFSELLVCDVSSSMMNLRTRKSCSLLPRTINGVATVIAMAINMAMSYFFLNHFNKTLSINPSAPKKSRMKSPEETRPISPTSEIPIGAWSNGAMMGDVYPGYYPYNYTWSLCFFSFIHLAK